jgi:hypothetical protein
VETKLIPVLLAASALNGFGQGLINFNNGNITATPGPVVAPIYLGSVGGTLVNGTDTSFRAALLGGQTDWTPAYIPGSRTNGPSSGPPEAGSLSPLASPSTGATWVTFRTGSLAGFVAVTTDSARSSGLAYGSTGMFQVVAWRGGFTTWTEAFAAWQSGTNTLIMVGASNPLNLAVTVTLDQPPPTLQGLESFALQTPPIPEPSAFLLAAAGAVIYFLFGRRARGRRAAS